MMTTDTKNEGRVRIAAPPGEILALLPRMGRVMLTISAGDITHERIGPVERVSLDGNIARLEGESHRAALDIGAIGTLVADRTGRMRDRALPRVQALAPDGRALYALIALDGLEPFDAALSEVATAELVPPLPKPGDRGDPPSCDGDLVRLLVDRLAEERATIEVALESEGVVQSWSGVASPTKPAMGFVNIIQPDFHLHARAGVVASWREEGRSRHALDADGIPIGLTVRVRDARA
jgi:putative heme degradation protein